MQLKKISLYGFKSFADKITIDFDKEDWLVVLVGPNGCGKSNIVDAILWVLGQQSPKAMRAQERSDVIFSGTHQRNPLNFTEVTLVLDDNEGILPLEYTSIAITRRMYRTGESDYLINRHPVRLKDIHDLFLNTALGPNGYAVFQQGKTDEIIQMTPKERRHIILRAAGVERFIEKKAEAEKKLEEADQNIDRVSDVVQEVGGRLTQLEKQAEKALYFQQKREAFIRLNRAIFLERWHQLESEKMAFTKNVEDLQKEIESIGKECDAWNREIEEEQHLLHRLEKNHKERGENLFTLQKKREFAQHEKCREEERLDSLIQNRERRLTEEMEWEQKRTERTDAHATWEDEWKALDLTRIENETLRDDLSSRLLREEKWEQEWVKERRENLAQRDTLLRQEQLIERGIQKTKIQKENLQQLVHDAEKERAALELERTRGKQEIERLETTMAVRKRVIHELQESRIELENERDARSKREEILRDEREILLQEMHELVARENVLWKLKEEKIGFSNDTKRILSEAKKKESPLYGKIQTLQESITCARGEEKQAATILRRYDQTLVVKSRNDLNTFLAYCREEGLQEFAVFCCEIKGISEKSLSSHFLHPVLSLSSLEESLSFVGRSEAWISQEYYLDAKGVLHHIRPGESHAFFREAELQEMSIKKESLSKRIKEKEKNISTTHDEREELAKEIRGKEELLRQENMAQAETQALLSRWEQDLKRWESNDQSVLHKQREWQKTTAHLSIELEEKERDLFAIAKQRKEMSVAIEEKERKAETHVEELMALREKKRALDDTHQSLAEKRATLRDRKKQWEWEDKRDLERIHWLRQETKKEMEQEERIRSLIEKWTHEITRMEKEIQNQEVLIREEEKKEGNCRTLLEEKRERQRESLEKKREIEEKKRRIELSLAEKNFALETLEKEKEEIFGEDFPPSNPEEFRLDEEIGYAERKMRRLRQEITQVAHVNMNAREEYEKEKERFRFLQKQMDDYTASRNEFVEIIANLQQESRKRYFEVFREIRHHFQNHFRILFGGGEADLLLLDGDVLESGVEITARPTGKKQRSMSLLSGGEKTLTAIALLLAIFRVKPSPFCLLDEVDAPLDERNVDRFLGLLDSFRDLTQFILITHNKRTMRKAQKIYGVSMEEKGVSKVLSMHLASEKATPVLL